METNNNRCGRSRAWKKFQEQHPEHRKLFCNIFQSVQQKQNQSKDRAERLFQREEDEINCEYVNMEKNQELLQHRENDDTIERQRKHSAVNKSVSWDSNLFNVRLISPVRGLLDESPNQMRTAFPNRNEPEIINYEATCIEQGEIEEGTGTNNKPVTLARYQILLQNKSLPILLKDMPQIKDQ